MAIYLNDRRLLMALRCRIELLHALAKKLKGRVGAEVHFEKLALP